MLALCVPSLTDSVPGELLPEYATVAFAPAVISTRSIKFPLAIWPPMVPVKSADVSILSVPVVPANVTVAAEGLLSSTVAPASMVMEVVSVAFAPEAATVPPGGGGGGGGGGAESCTVMVPVELTSARCRRWREPKSYHPSQVRSERSIAEAAPRSR
jgi:hypothetical protein